MIKRRSDLLSGLSEKLPTRFAWRDFFYWHSKENNYISLLKITKSLKEELCLKKALILMRSSMWKKKPSSNFYGQYFTCSLAVVLFLWGLSCLFAYFCRMSPELSPPKSCCAEFSLCFCLFGAVSFGFSTSYNLTWTRRKKFSALRSLENSQIPNPGLPGEMSYQVCLEDFFHYSIEN